MEKDFCLYIKVADVIFKFNFQATDWLPIRDFYIKQFVFFFKPFLINSPQLGVDYTINIVSKKRYKYILKNRKTELYILLYKKKVTYNAESYYHLSIIQLIMIIEIILQKLLLKNDGFLLHSSVSGLKNRSMIFLGKEGAGKSTITQLIAPEYPILADDRSYIRKKLNKFYFYRPLYSEKNQNVKKNVKKYGIYGVFFLKKSKNCKIVEVKDSNVIIDRLLKQIVTNPELIDKQMKALYEFIKINKFYLFYFNKNKGDLITVMNAFVKNNYGQTQLGHPQPQ